MFGFGHGSCVASGEREVEEIEEVKEVEDSERAWLKSDLNLHFRCDSSFTLSRLARIFLSVESTPTAAAGGSSSFMSFTSFISSTSL